MVAVPTGAGAGMVAISATVGVAVTIAGGGSSPARGALASSAVMLRLADSFLSLSASRLVHLLGVGGAGTAGTGSGSGPAGRPSEKARRPRRG